MNKPRLCKCGGEPVIFRSAGVWNVEGCSGRGRPVIIQAATKELVTRQWNSSEYAHATKKKARKP